ncbi:formate-dependent phosphoribosylglycinamide formyltransferase [Sediminibacillus dalangtanensis]|uniref:Formate-dependent phosphoribosylglycinamide formyltransferase n=1 Tax=Sediminibacillus dalangtanensis TaxID=2729421 RepID=A0ABX7VTX7_9BACI|nr:formate-dependent phosphoribosylglycinamide formyltransferase [Sediminibacillus dalangtanensis]QTM99075.1 formate-dependent phosphoribosylglycinamide formyltransferase [Sediminibacillus dalangtanensis]
MFGVPGQEKAMKMVLLGSGELGKEMIIEAQRLGVETVAIDRYPGAPAMQVAHHYRVIDMLDGAKLKEAIENENPDLIVPEIEAIATDALVELERQGYRVVPTAYATQLTMDREGIRRLASEQLKLPTAGYAFAESLDELKQAVHKIGTPCVIKPLMSSSGKGQTVCRTEGEIEASWQEAIKSGRGKNTRVIVEEFISFDSEITLLTVRSSSGTVFCPPIGHKQQDGDYIQSWQPHTMSEGQIREAEDIAKKITDHLGGFGVFGVELFITKQGVYFSEVSPRPHDTGMVTMATQDLSEFALHVRAILGLPVEEVTLISPGVSQAVKSESEGDSYFLEGIEQALQTPGTQLRLFGKPTTSVGRRLAVVLNKAEDVKAAKQQVAEAASKLKVKNMESVGKL